MTTDFPGDMPYMQTTVLTCLFKIRFPGMYKPTHKFSLSSIYGTSPPPDFHYCSRVAADVTSYYVLQF